MDVEGKIDVGTSKTIIFTLYSLKLFLWCDIKVHRTAVGVCGSYTDFLCEPLALYWAECKFIIFHVFSYSFASCLCVTEVITYIKII